MSDVKEREEQAQLIIDATLKRLRDMGFGVVADGTVHGNGIWLDSLRVRPIAQPTGASQ